MTVRRYGAERRARGAAAGALVLVLALALTACGGDSGDGADVAKETIPATQVCGGLSPKAARALEQISETEKFEDRYYDSADTLKARLHDADRRGGDKPATCVIKPDVADPDESPSKMTVIFEEVERVPAPQPPAVALTTLPVGLLAEGDDAQADLWFACEVPGVGKPVVHGQLLYGNRPRDLDPREANLRVLQDLSHRLALAMGCPRAGDVPAY
ncbi:hypothetical protein ACIGEZ_05495 [Streptomyces sp. NPDC085481]|uniref:hypothetical protein n=1 Tax=Streptomyces sp. NPDC085481 TaxID=3365727 RepID=UPI0037D0A7E6